MYAKTTNAQAGRVTGAACGDMDEVRAQLRRMWSGVASAWGEHAAFIDARGAAITERMLELAAPKAGQRVLDLACGPGGAGLAAAERVGPEGQVLLSDIAPGMVEIARSRAQARGLKNVHARVLDLEQIDEEERIREPVGAEYFGSTQLAEDAQRGHRAPMVSEVVVARAAVEDRAVASAVLCCARCGRPGDRHRSTRSTIPTRAASRCCARRWPSTWAGYAESRPTPSSC